MVCNGGGDWCGRGDQCVCGEDGVSTMKNREEQENVCLSGFLCLFPKKIYRFMSFVGDWFVYWVYGFDLLENSVLIALEFGEEHEEFNGLDL